MKKNNIKVGYYFAWLVFGLMAGVVFLLWHGDIKILPRAENRAATPPFLIHGFFSAISKAAPAVVSISTYSYVKNTSANTLNGETPLQQFLSKKSPHTPLLHEDSAGSGIIFDKHGHILTNYHVIEHHDEIQVHLKDGRTVAAKILGSDPDTDLAVLKINLKNLPVAIIGNSDKLKVGDIVLAIGDPYAIGQTVTQGIISATGRTRVTRNTYENFLQTDAAINPGNSGGALINTAGEIIGINSNIYSSTGSYQGISFAIPVNMAKHVFNQIVTNGYVVRGWLGVEGQQLTPGIIHSAKLKPTHGILITGVDIDGPGYLAGLKIGDIITGINNRKIYTTQDILKQIAAGKPGDVFRIEGFRKRQSFVIRATLGQRPLMSR